MEQKEKNNQGEWNAQENRNGALGDEDKSDNLTQREKESLASYYKSQALADNIVEMYNDDAELTPAGVLVAFGFFIARLERGCAKERQGDIYVEVLSVICKGYALDKTLQREVDKAKDKDQKEQ